ncbi:MAG: BatD family protein [Flavobacteriales bacterium]|nr:BatD family protein [Flavobacteriales bacterium]
MNWMKDISALVVFVCAFGNANAQTADAVLTPQEILIGEQAVLTLSVSYPKNSLPGVAFPLFGDTIITDLEIVRSTDIDTLETADDVAETRIEQKLYLTAWDTGYYAIPPLEITVNGEKQLTEAFLLTVKTVEIDTTGGIKPSLDIYEVEVGWQDYLAVYWYYPAGALGLLGLIAATLLILRARKKRQADRPIVKKEEPQRPADQIALEALDQIKMAQIFKRGKIKQHHTEITDVLRDYLESVYQIPAHELTSNQILTRLRYVGLTEIESRHLREILNRADMVKFAKDRPDDLENQEAVNQTIEFVKTTASRMLSDKEIHE